MPLYLFETPGTDVVRKHEIAMLSAHRFPEVVVESRYETGDGTQIWVCRAPGPAHIARWGQAAGLDVRAVRHVLAADTGTPTPSSCPPNPSTTTTQEQP